LEAGVSPKLISVRSGVDEEVKNVDTGLSPVFAPSVVSSAANVYWPVLEDAFEAELEEAVEADEEGA
jgi:hypothetical protein